MAKVFKVERFVRDKNGERIPLLDKQGHPVLVKRGPEKGKAAYEKEEVPRWRARVYDRVARRNVTKTFRKRGAADKWAKDMEGRKDLRQSLQADRRTVAQYVDWWLTMKARGAVHGKSWRQLKPPRARTMSNYRKLLRRWITEPPKGLPPLGVVGMDELTHGYLDAFYSAMLSVTTVDTVNRFHAVLGQAFSEAWRKGTLPYNPCDRASVPQVDGEGAEGEDDREEGAGSKSLDREQADRFLKAARELEREGAYSALWHLLLQTGLRPNEAFALAWEDLDLDATAPTVRVRRGLVMKRRTDEQRERREAAGWRFEPPKTKNGIRTVQLPDLAAKELRAWRTLQKWHRRIAGDEWEEHGLVFTTSKGTPLGSGNGYRRSFARVMAHAHGEEGVDGDLGTWSPKPKREHLTGPVRARRFRPAFRVYDLRHTCITLWLAGGMQAQVASKLAGHATTAFTLTVYAKALPEQEQEAAAIMDRIFGT